MNNLSNNEPLALVVAESRSIRRKMEVELERYGMDIDFAETAADALKDITREDIYDIIFLDVILADIDGFTVCKEIRKHNLYKKTPIIMLIGKNSKMEEIKGKMAGGNESLTKPIREKDVKDVLKQYLKL